MIAEADPKRPAGQEQSRACGYQQDPEGVERSRPMEDVPSTPYNEVTADSYDQRNMRIIF
jgi:hypothetical protein